MLGPASERAVSFARHLPAAGWDPSVVTVRVGLHHRHADQPQPAVPTLRTRSPELSRLLGPLRRRAQGSGAGPTQPVVALTGGPATGRLRRLVRDYLYLPDGQTMWIPFAIAGLRSALRSVARPAVIMSTSVPYSAHLACLRAARSEGVPWVAEFRDPWSQVDQAIRPRSRARKRIDEVLERRVVESASALVVTTELSREAMASSYPELPTERIWVVRNGFEPADETPQPPGRDQRLRLVQAGSVPDDAAIEPLLWGLDRVARAHPGELHLRVFGPCERWRRAASALGFPPWLEIAGLVGPAQVREAVNGASANVLLRPGPQHRQYVAAKLMGYLGARRPVLGVVDPEGEMARLGGDYGDLRLVAPYTAQAVANAVSEILAQHRAGALQGPVQTRANLAELTRGAQAARLAAALDSVLASS